MNIDWSKAPEGATHYTPGSECLKAVFWRVVEGVSVKAWVVLKNGSIAECRSACEFDLTRPDAVARPWGGEGLPPVGAECEFMWNSETKPIEYKRIVVVGHDEGLCVFRWVEGPSKGEYQAAKHRMHYGDPIFLPLRTPEQLAAEEREKAVDEMVTVWKRTMGRFAQEERGLAEMLYDAGYRRRSHDH